MSFLESMALRVFIVDDAHCTPFAYYSTQQASKMQTITVQGPFTGTVLCTVGELTVTTPSVVYPLDTNGEKT